MDLSYGEERTKKFVTNIGLVTSNGPFGHNIMACEWTHQVSYSPGLIAVCIHFDDATNENISKSKEFGINLCASDQNVLSSIAGGSSGKSVNKIEALKELGFKFFKAKKIDAFMVEGAAMSAECRLFRELKLGDHTTFIGEIVELHPASGKEPLVYHSQKYWALGQSIPKPPQQELERIKSVVEKHKKN